MTAWTLLPTLVVRTAAFPWQLMDSLSWPLAAAAADRLADQMEHADALRARLTAARQLTRGEAARLRNDRPLGPGAPVPAAWRDEWNRLADDIAASRVTLLAHVERESADTDRAVAAVLRDPRFLDAVVCSSPGVYRDICRAGPEGPGTRLRRQIASYLQRLAAKCETMSFFGPINYASVNAVAPETTVASAGHRACARRRAYASAWVWHRLRDRALADPEQAAGLVPRPKTLRRTHRALKDHETARSVHAAADGKRSLGEIAGLAGLDAAQAAAGLSAALARGVLACEGLPDDVALDPVRSFARMQSTTPAFRRCASAAASLLDKYPAASPDAKLELLDELRCLLPGEPQPRRGRFYSDRIPVHEAALGTLRMTVGGSIARDLTSAVPASLDVLACAAERTRDTANEAVARRLGPGRFPFAQVIRCCSSLTVPRDDWLPASIARLAAGAGNAEEIDLRAAFPALPPTLLPVLCSADVMVAADNLARYREGVTPLVLGDIHDAALLTPWALQFHPQADAVLALRDREIERALGDVQAVSIIARRSTGLPPLRFPGRVLELGALSGDAHRIWLDDLYVDSDGARAALRAAGNAGPLFLHNGELESAVHTAFALPRVRPLSVNYAPYMPRLRWGNVVLSRRRWLLDGDAVRACFQPDAAAERLGLLRGLTRRNGVPPVFFAKVPSERKPVYVDTASPLLSAGLARLASRADQVTVTEVLPGPGQLWLREGEACFAAELRCVYLKPGAGR